MAHSGKSITFDMDVLPNQDKIYSLGNKDQRWKIYGDLAPTLSKVFPSFYATANNDNRKIAFFGKITRTNVNIPWRIKLKITATIPNHPEYAYTDWDIDYWGHLSATKAQYIKVNHGTNYALYSLQIYYPKDTSNNEILIGVYIYANNNYSNSAYARQLAIDFFSSENCTFNFYDDLLYRESITPANYTAVGISLTSTGYQETGDANSNTYDRTYVNNNKKARVAIVAGSICVGDETGYAGIDQGVTFDISYPILYMGTAMAANAQRSDFYLYQVSVTSTVNTTGLTHVANGILYMTGTLDGTTFTCNSKTLTYIVPTDEDGLIYIPVAINTNATTQSFYFLGGIARMFWYKDGAFRPYTGELAQSTYGNINSDGSLQTNDITIDNGDKLIVTDSDDDNKIARTSLTFDGSTKTQALSKAGTWETFLTAHQTYTAVSGKKPTGNQTPGFGSTFDIEQVSQAASGQVTVTERTVTIPSTIATNSAIGLVKPWYSHSVASTGPTTGTNATTITVNAIQTEEDRYYAIESDSNGRLFVNVPWTNINENYLTSHNNLVKQTLKEDNINYKLLASSQASPTSETAYETIYNTKIYINPSLNSINAGRFTIHDKATSPNEKVYMEWNSIDQSLDFIFA